MADHGPTTASAIPAWIEHWATITPDVIALECRGATMTYRELDQAGQRVASRLHNSTAEPGHLIAVPSHRRLDTVSLILGILKAGCAYLPLDPDHPAARTEEILTLARPELAIAEAEAALEDTGIPVLRPDACLRHPAPFHPVAAAPGLAYVMPTSGTAGALKLAEITHASVCHNLRALNGALGGITPQDAYLHVASFAFSSSVRQLLLPLSAGARVVIATGAERFDPQEMLHRLRDSHISVLDIIPSVLAVLIEALESLPAPRTAGHLGDHLRLLLLASEPLPGDLIRRWRASGASPGTHVYNMYGQTETAGIVCLQPVGAHTQHESTVPIGHPLPGTDLHLLDEAQRPVEDGATGEIALSGTGVACGYRGDVPRTAEYFTPVSPDAPRLYRTGDLGRRTVGGAIAFIGRRDRMVKVRGQRTNLAEIERVLASHELISEAAVVDVTAGNSSAVLRGFVRCKPGVLDATAAGRLRQLPNGLRVVDLNPRETDFLYDEIFVSEVYQRHGIAMPDNACVIDAGANIGLFSLSVATRYPTARVFAFEPAAPTAAALQSNIVANSCTNVQIRVAGLSNRPGAATFTFYPHSSGLTSMHASHSEEHAHLVNIISYQLSHGAIPQGDELQEFTADLAEAKLVQQSLQCDLIRLSDFLDAEDIDTVDLLKVDVQKSEAELLDGIRDEHWDMIKQIVVEVHDIDGRLAQMAAQLTQRGYTVTTEQDHMLAGSPMHYLYARRDSARPAAPPVPLPADRPAPLGVSSEQLLSFLASRLPAYQVPESVEILTALPRTVSGKLDRAALVRRETASKASGRAADPADNVTADIMSVWSDVLGKPVTATDDFFALGGNSLSAARVITRIRARYRLNATIRLIFQERRLDRFAAGVQELLTARASDVAAGHEGNHDIR